MTLHFGFEPDPDRARALDRRMRAELASSLAHLRERSDGVVPFDDEAIVRRIGGLHGDHPASPRIFGEYYRLADALFAGDLAGAEEGFARLASEEPATADHRLGPLHPPSTCRRCALYHALMTGSEDTDVDFRPPPADVSAGFVRRYREGMALMERAAPDLAAEVASIVHEVVGVVGDPEAETRFDGGSHYRLWGALFLDAEAHSTPEAVAVAVAHESAHALLFGFCVEEPLVHDDGTILYDSPLRPDPRPMDGVYHATFVAARMHLARSRLSGSGRLPAGSRKRVRASLERERERFEAGHRIVAAHARLSPHGAGLMRAARAYMDAAG